MDHTFGLQSAACKATRARLLRFFETCDPNHRWWLGEERVSAEDMPTDSLRTAAFVFADDFWVVRRRNRFWRNYNAQHGGLSPAIPAGLKPFKKLQGAELDAWLADAQSRPSPLAIAAE